MQRTESAGAPIGTMASTMPMSEAIDTTVKTKKSTRWLPIKDGDIMLLKDIFIEMDVVRASLLHVPA
jgi:hypothetical protein